MRKSSEICKRRIGGVKKLDFKKHPAPDLAVEIEISRRVSDRKAIYAAFGVPELWLYDNKTLQVLHLKAGAYVAATASKSFPDLPLKQFESFLAMRSEKSEHEVVKAFRDWLRKS